ncbi:peroxidase 7-like, partial [Trifolium medium]|nr:peroxidase 7-like [Trifolium medium]
MSNSYLQLLLLLVLYIISANSAQPYEGNYGEAVFTLQVPTLEENNLDNLLSFGYYHKSCPQFESILHNKVKEWIKKDDTLAASLLRLHFHDCSVR